MQSTKSSKKRTKTAKSGKGGRKYFTLEEDFKILTHYNKRKNLKTIRDIVEELYLKLSKRTKESIRNRLSRLILKLSFADRKRIIDDYKKFKDEGEPYFVIFKREGEKYEKEILDILNEADRSAHMSSMAKSTNLKKRKKPKSVKPKNKVNKRVENGLKSDSKAINVKMNRLLEDLDKNDEKSIEKNALILRDIMKNFQVSFGVSVEEQMKYFSQQPGQKINVEDLRQMCYNKTTSTPKR